MTTEEQLERSISERQRFDLRLDHAATAAGVVFASENTVRIFAERHATEVVQIGSGWLAKNPSRVTIVFRNGTTRRIPARSAFQRAGILVVPIDDQEMKFDFQDVDEVIITDEDGWTIETIAGRPE